MGSQTNGKASALDYFTVGRDTFDAPEWVGLTLEHFGLWAFLYAEACRTRGNVTMATVLKATGYARSKRHVRDLFVALVEHDLLAVIEPDLYYVSGFGKYQVDVRYPSETAEATRERKRLQRLRERGMSRACHDMSRRDVTTSHERVTTEGEGEGEGEEYVLEEKRVTNEPPPARVRVPACDCPTIYADGTFQTVHAMGCTAGIDAGSPAGL